MSYYYSQPFIVNNSEIIKRNQKPPENILLHRRTINVHFSTDTRQYNNNDYEDYINSTNNINQNTGIYNNSYLFANNCELQLQTVVNNISKVSLIDFTFNNPLSKKYININDSNNEFKLSCNIRAPWIDLVSKVYYYTELIDPDDFSIKTNNNKSNHFKSFYQQVENYYNVPRNVDNIDYAYTSEVPNVNGAFFCLANDTGIDVSYISDYTVSSSVSGITNNVNSELNTFSGMLRWVQVYNNNIKLSDDTLNVYTNIIYKLYTNLLELTEDSVDIYYTNENKSNVYKITNRNIVIDDTETIVDINGTNVSMKQITIYYELTRQNGEKLFEFTYTNNYNLFFINTQQSDAPICSISGNNFNIVPQGHDNLVKANFTGIAEIVNMYKYFPAGKCGIFEINLGETNGVVNSISGYTQDLYVASIVTNNDTVYDYRGNFTGYINYVIEDPIYFNNIVSGIYGIYGRFPIGITNSYCDSTLVKEKLIDKVKKEINHEIILLDTINSSGTFSKVLQFTPGKYTLNQLICQMNNTTINCSGLQIVSEPLIVNSYFYVIVQATNCNVITSASLNNKNYIEFAVKSFENGNVTSETIEIDLGQDLKGSWTHTFRPLEISLYLLKFYSNGLLLEANVIETFDFNSIKVSDNSELIVKNQGVSLYNSNYIFSNTFNSMTYKLGNFYNPYYYIPDNVTIVIRPQVNLDELPPDAIFEIRPELPEYIEFNNGIITCKPCPYSIEYKFIVYYTGVNKTVRLYDTFSIFYIKYNYSYSKVSLIKDIAFDPIKQIEVPNLTINAFVYTSIKFNNNSSWIPDIIPQENYITENIKLQDNFIFNTITGDIFGTPNNLRNNVVQLKAYFNAAINGDLNYIDIYDSDNNLIKPLFNSGIIAPLDLVYTTEMNINVIDKEEYFYNKEIKMYCFQEYTDYSISANNINVSPIDLISLSISADNNIQKSFMKLLLFNYTDSRELTSTSYYTKYFQPNDENNNKRQTLPNSNNTIKSNYTETISNINSEQYSLLSEENLRPFKKYLFNYVSESSNAFVYHSNTYNYPNELENPVKAKEYIYYYKSIPINVYNEISGYLFPYIIESDTYTCNYYTNNNKKYVDMSSIINTKSIDYQKIILYNQSKITSSIHYLPISIDKNQNETITVTKENDSLNKLMVPSFYYNYLPLSILPIQLKDYYHWVDYIWLYISSNTEWNNIYDSKTMRYYFAKILLKEDPVIDSTNVYNSINDNVIIISPDYTPENRQLLNSLNKIHVKLFDPNGNILEPLNSPEFNFTFTLQFEIITDYIENTELNSGQRY